MCNCRAVKPIQTPINDIFNITNYLIQVCQNVYVPFQKRNDFHESGNVGFAKTKRELLQQTARFGCVQNMAGCDDLHIFQAVNNGGIVLQCIARTLRSSRSYLRFLCAGVCIYDIFDSCRIACRSLRTQHLQLSFSMYLRGHMPTS
ncbi:hypothetical protein GJ496_008098 [Pomphorhynchus laevis]|nr:hypothetical protein GJ496_010525 [Pomphorhynchus laevis]KAI0983398.1 hypothetical protein GJ496_008098 [Pomphorhynchus laevis]